MMHRKYTRSTWAWSIGGICLLILLVAGGYFYFLYGPPSADFVPDHRARAEANGRASQWPSLAAAVRLVTDDPAVRAQLLAAGAHGRRPALLDKLWNSYPATVDGSDANAVDSAIEAIQPRCRAPVSKLPNRQDFNAMLETFILANASRKPGMWYQRLVNQGYTIDPRFNTIWPIPASKDPATLINYALHASSVSFKGYTYPSRLDGRHIRALVYNVRSLDSGGVPVLQMVRAFTLVRGYVSSTGSIMLAKNSIRDVIRSRGSATVCETMVLVKPAGSPDHTMRVVVLYMYYDSSSGHWVLPGYRQFPPLQWGNGEIKMTLYN